MKYIKTWAERCEEHPDHNGIVTERMIQARMQEEIDDLRAALVEPVQEQPICDECGKSKRDGWALYCVKCVEPMFAPPQRKPLTEEGNMTTLREAAMRQALEALEGGADSWQRVGPAIDALKAALAEEAMQRLTDVQQEMESEIKVDKAEPVQQAGKHEVKNLADYEFKTYRIGGAELEAGFYSTDELRDLVKSLEKMNSATERSMRKMK